MVIKKILFVTLASISLSVAQACNKDQVKVENTYTVYVVPQLPAAQMYTKWAPVLQQIGKMTGLCFDLFVPATIPEFESEFIKGTPDFAFMNPYHQVMAYKSQGYIPLIADSKIKLEGIVLVKADSTLTKLSQLKGEKVAFPSPNAFAASLLVRSILAKEGIEIEPIYVKSHNNVYRSIIIGDVVAGGGVNNTYNREPVEIKNEVKILYRTPVFMPHPFSANPRISQRLRDQVIQAFLDLAQTDAGRKMLDEIQIPEPVKVNYKDDYLPLEKIGVEKFVVNGTN
ncbi:phosphate/phosphite/phosphonate ABC transporter substrate-binding protein [Orrella sp. NBD-18]|uniref:Phosphate/phosphite/phosphonate ABC transporter substrate-binding protein n=1 Tax=Sheuella amnicola TaxID=2707330 RepID=A0A6B2QZ59_9BURK|nr:phosphate/phosphite/phosphonate ABC transporter substrate-binding protein [Sheuella amnicola]NDY82584.1 phosphate/phosphite/phosphonate ABC transporter substrate-binding protein [Sheuella amnicola]HBI82683.1 phosphate ABC transporter [Alcaligenaceae bacterium]